MNEIIFTNPEIIGSAVGWLGLLLALESTRRLRIELIKIDARLSRLERCDQADLNSEDD